MHHSSQVTELKKGSEIVKKTPMLKMEQVWGGYDRPMYLNLKSRHEKVASEIDPEAFGSDDVDAMIYEGEGSFVCRSMTSHR